MSERFARGWSGDDDLAYQLAAVLGAVVIPMLKPLPVDLDELASILEGNLMYGGGRIDLRSGEVWQGPIEYTQEIGGRV